MSITISATVDIAASAQEVWDVLTDFAAYGEWNPHMRIDGIAQTGARLVVRLLADGGRGLAFRPRVLAAEPGRELRWIGRLGVGGIADGEHFFVLTPNADGTTRLTHGETYSGALVALVKLFGKSSLEKSHNGYEDFNQFLRQRVESWLILAQEVLGFRGRVLSAVADVNDQAGDCDVLVRVEGDGPAVGLILAVDVGGPRLGVGIGSEP